MTNNTVQFSTNDLSSHVALSQQTKIEQVVTTESINHISFNSEQDCFAAATSNGFFIYSIYPTFRLIIRRIIDGGIKHIQMIGRSNVVLLVPTGNDPMYPSNQVLIWDDIKLKHIGVVKFASEVKSLDYSQQVFTVSQDEICSAIGMQDVSVVGHISSGFNPRGLQAVAFQQDDLGQPSNEFVMATLHEEVGKVILTWFSKQKKIVQTNEEQKQLLDSLVGGQHYSVDQSKFQQTNVLIVNAHQNAISCFALNQEGTLLATTSELGTLIRLHSTRSGKQTNEFRRGTVSVQIQDLAFSIADSKNRYLTCCSDKGTVHIFNVPKPSSAEDNEQSSLSESKSQNTRSFFSALSYIMPVAGSEWSFAKFRLDYNDLVPNNSTNSSINLNSAQQNANMWSNSVCVSKAVIRGEYLHVITTKGKYYKVKVKEAGGELISDEVHQFMT